MATIMPTYMYLNTFFLQENVCIFIEFSQFVSSGKINSQDWFSEWFCIKLATTIAWTNGDPTLMHLCVTRPESFPGDVYDDNSSII